MLNVEKVDLQVYKEIFVKMSTCFIRTTGDFININIDKQIISAKN